MKNFNVILGAVVLSCVPAGCMHRPGGSMMSLDRFTYESTVYEPKTLTLIDTRTNEVLWTMEVPVGQRVTVGFYENKSKGYADYPDVMRWEVQQATALDSVLRSQISVPDRWSRRMDMTLRPAPEFYPGAEASVTP